MTQATTETTFNIGDYEDKHKEPATWNQVRGLSFKFAKTAKGIDNRLASQVRGCLWSQVKSGKLSFKQAHDLFQKKSLPKLYKEMIDAYLAEQE